MVTGNVYINWINLTIIDRETLTEVIVFSTTNHHIHTVIKLPYNMRSD